MLDLRSYPSASCVHSQGSQHDSDFVSRPKPLTSVSNTNQCPQHICNLLAVDDAVQASSTFASSTASAVSASHQHARAGSPTEPAQRLMALTYESGSAVCSSPLRNASLHAVACASRH